MQNNMNNKVELFDHNQIEKFRLRAYNASKKELNRNKRHELFLHNLAREDLLLRLSCVKREFQRAVVLHSFDTSLAQNLLDSGKIASVLTVETDMLYLRQEVFDYSNSENLSVLMAPREGQHISQIVKGADFVTTILSMQLINDLPGYLRNIVSNMAPAGLFLGVMLGEGSLLQLRDVFLQAEIELLGGASPRIYPFAGLKNIGDLLKQSGFEMVVVDNEEITIEYKSFDKIIGDLRAWGMQNALFMRDKRPIIRPVLERAIDLYKAKHRNAKGDLVLNFNLIWFSGWVAYDNQYKPNVV